MSNRVKAGFLSFVIPLLVFCGPPYAADLTLNTWQIRSFNETGPSAYCERLLTEAFRRLGYEIAIVHKPAERSITDANLGNGDGEFLRISGLSALYPNLIQVPEKIYDMEFVAFALRSDISVEGWGSLTPYTVGFVIGWKILEENIRNVRVRTAVSSEESLFQMLVIGRVDLAVYARHYGWETIRRMGLKGVWVLEPPLAVEPMYLYLHRMHRKIVPMLVDALQGLRADGTIQTFHDRYLIKE